MQAGVFLLLAPLANISIGWASLPLMAVVLGTLAFALTGLGFMLAWMIDSTQGFHAIMNLFLFPMWLLSGAVFPPTGAAEWIRLVMLLNPIRGVLAGGDMVGVAAAVGDSLMFIVVFGAITLVISTAGVHYRRV